MKRIVSLLMCALLVIGTLGASAYAAAEATKTDAFLSGMKASKSISLKISDESFESFPINIKNVTASLVDDDIEVSGTAFGFIKVRLLVVDGMITAYIPGLFCKANVSDILGLDAINLDIVNDLWENADKLFDYKDKGYLVFGSKTEEAPLTVESYVPDLAAIVRGEFASAIEPGTDISEMSVQEILSLITAASPQAGSQLALLSQASAKFYYNAAGELVNIVIKMPNEECTAMENFDISNMISSELNFDISSISTNVPESAVAAPAFAFDISGLLSSIIKRFVVS